MNILSFLKKRSKGFYVYLAGLGLVNSFLFSVFLILINKAVTGTGLPFPSKYLLPVFAILLVLSYLVRRLFQTHIITLTNNLLFDFEMTLLGKIRFASYEHLEKLGKEKVYTAVSDTRILAQVPEMLINLFNAAVIIICCLIYLFSISWTGGVVITALMAALLALYLLRNKQIEKDLNLVRDLQNDYYRYLKDFLYGFREISMSTVRNSNIFTKYLKKNRVQSRQLSLQAGIKYMSNELAGTMSWYVVLGIIILILPLAIPIDRGQLTSFVITTLYLMGPVSSIILFIPTITRLKIATERMEQLESEINIKITKPVELEGCDVKMDFYNIRFEDLCYEYNLNEGQNIFALGPVNLTINKGEIIFITGGNGSGKSTFVKLLTGLYQPTSGKIYFNNEELSARPGLYSNQFAAIFTDSYLFLDNYNGFDLREDNPLLEEYTQQMQLKSILEKDSQGRIRTYLSKGQQKRLSMIYALLEQKDLLVLDEWAAEQDPLFRKYFYTEFLPLLRDMGKTIIAITHDDAYFSCADRIIKFNYGRIVSEKHLVERILPPTA